MNDVVKEWTVSEETPEQTVHSFLKNTARFSRQLLKQVKMKGSVSVNGQQVFLRKPVQINDRIVVMFPPEERGRKLHASPGPLIIAYEDEDLLIVEKQPGVAVVPSTFSKGSSLADWVLDYYIGKEISATVHVVTRLDRDTSGLMVIAKHQYSHSLLTNQDKPIQRHYQAIVSGHPIETGIINEPIARKVGSIVERTVSEEGKDAITSYKVRKYLDGCSLVDVQLMTGRTHQIRVHMAHLGHPLAGDTLYGGEEVKGLQGQALHCCQLIIQHPWTKDELVFNSEAPDTWDILQ